MIDGTDGAGKTPLVQTLCAALRERGHAVATHAPYRVEEVFPLWEREPRRAAEIITAIMRRFRAAHPREVIVWDRGWPTAWVSTDDPIAREAFAPLPAVTILLLSTTRRTRQKAVEHGSSRPWMVEDALVERFNAAYRGLADQAPAARVLTFTPDQRDVFALDAVVEAAIAAGGL